MFRRPKGAAFVPPAEISRLPVSLLRTALVTRDPAATAQGIVEYRERMAAGDEWEPPLVLPQRVMFQQWKSDLQTDGASRPEHKDWLRSAESIAAGARASGVPNSTVQRVKPAPYTYEQALAARQYGGQFPEPPRDVVPAPVISRDLPARGRFLEPPPEAYATTVEAVGQREEGRRYGSCQRALEEAAAVQARTRAIVRGGR